MTRKTKKAGAPSGAAAVARLQEQVRTAKELAAIPGLDLLEDAATNPAARERGAELRDARHTRELEMGHARSLRALRSADRREAAAERAEDAVLQAREADSPALSVLALTRNRMRGAGLALGASLLLSVGSALGVEALATSWGAPGGVGYLAEIGLTGLSTAAIVWRGALARHRAVLASWQQRALVALIAVPLVVSVVASTAGSGPVGAACSIGAAAFAALSYLISITASEAIQRQIQRLDTQEQQPQVATTATSGDTEPPATPGGDGWTVAEVEDAAVREVAADGVSAIEAHLAEWDGAQRSHGGAGPDEGLGDDGAGGASGPVAVCDRPGSGVSAHTEDSRSHGRSHEPSERLSAAERKRREGVVNRRRVADYLAEYPDAQTVEIAAHTGLSEPTVRRIRGQLKAEGGE